MEEQFFVTFIVPFMQNPQFELNVPIDPELFMFDNFVDFMNVEIQNHTLLYWIMFYNRRNLNFPDNFRVIYGEVRHGAGFFH